MRTNPTTTQYASGGKAFQEAGMKKALRAVAVVKDWSRFSF